LTSDATSRGDVDVETDDDDDDDDDRDEDEDKENVVMAAVGWKVSPSGKEEEWGLGAEEWGCMGRWSQSGAIYR
jgi:hypothetical protein